MSKERILIIDGDFETTELLRVSFEGQDYEVLVASRGEDALLMLRKKLPRLIILDEILPGMDGYQVWRELRQTTRTSHIPIIFLMEKNEHSDKVKGLELAADDYVSKPFDIEDVNVRVKNILELAEANAVDGIFEGLPGLRFVEEALRELQKTSAFWTYIDVKITDFDHFQEVYGFIAGTAILRLVALILGGVVYELGTPNDFVGQPSESNFAIITYSEKFLQIEEQIIIRFNSERLRHYTVMDRQQQYITLPNGEERPLMSISIRSTHQFPIEGMDIT